MAFQLEPHEGPLEGIERIAREEARAALAALDRSEGAVGDDGVHEARKRSKRSRALLRLVRSGMAKDRRAEEQGRFRAAGKALADLRDARVLLDSLDEVAGGAMSAASLEGLRDALEGRYQAARSAALDGVGLDAAASQLAAAADAPAWELDGGLEVLEAGLQRSAKRARKAFAAAQEEPTGEALHTWRKRAKDLRHQVEVLTPAWPQVLEPWAEALHALTDHLGDRHDLDVLAEAVEEVGAAFATPANRAAVDDVLVGRRAVCTTAAFGLGARLHAESPEAFAGRMAAYLAAWSR